MTRRLLVAAGLLLLPTALAGQGGATVREATVDGVTAHRLGNGLRLLLVPDRSRPVLTVQVTYAVGSRHEGYGESGMAHLLEHLLFRGTPSHPDIPAELAARGASPNGTTHPDRTTYVETLPAGEDNLRWALEMEADRMVHSTFDAGDLAGEMPVVLNEFEAGENSAINVLRQRVMAAAYPWHNYGRPTIGTPSDVAGVPIERLRAFYRRYYQPDNAVAVVVGDFDARRALAIAEATLGAIPRPVRDGTGQLWPTHTREPSQDGERGVALRRPADAEAVILGWHVPAAAHPDAAAVEVLAEVLGAPGTGRLFLSVLGPGIGANITAYTLRLREPGMLFAQAVLRRGDPAETARDAIFQAIGRLETTEPPTEVEVERAKAVLLKGIANEVLDPVALASRLGEWEAIGDWRLFFVHRDRLREVTAADVSRVAAAYLRPGNMTVGILKPTATPIATALPEVDGDAIAAAVAAHRGAESVVEGEPLDVTPSALERRTVRSELGGGMHLALLARESRGAMVTARLSLRTGGAGTPADPVVAELTAQLLLRGTIARDRVELADALTALGADLDVRATSAGVVATLRAPRPAFDAAVRLAAEVLRHPRFDAREFEVLRQARIAILDQQRTDPQAIASRTLRRQLSPSGIGEAGYLLSVDEERRAIGRTTLDAIREFHASRYGASRIDVAIVGPVALDTARSVLAAAFGDWGQRDAAMPAATAPPPRPALDTVITVPARANAFLLLGRRLPISRDDPAFATLVVADQLLGGGFLTSRLAERLRHRDGLSYGVRSEIGVGSGNDGATWTAMVIHAPGNLAAVRGAIEEELRRAAREGFAEDELHSAVAGWLAARRLERSDDAVLAGRLLEQSVLGRTWQEEADLEARVGAVSREEVRRFVADRLQLGALSIVAVGAFPPDLGTAP